jgi:hypothetical protein
MSFKAVYSDLLTVSLRACELQTFSSIHYPNVRIKQFKHTKEAYEEHDLMGLSSETVCHTG